MVFRFTSGIRACIQALCLCCAFSSASAVERNGPDSVHTRVSGRSLVFNKLPAANSVTDTSGKQIASRQSAWGIQQFGRDSVYARASSSAALPLPNNADWLHPEWTQRLDRMRDEVRAMERADRAAVGSAVVTASAFSYGYVLWLLRGGLLLTSLLSTLPAWHSFDPLPVLNSSRRRRCQEEGSDPLEELFDDKQTKGRGSAYKGTNRASTVVRCVCNLILGRRTSAT